MSRHHRTRTITREAVANVAAWKVVTGPLMLVAMAVGALAAGNTITDTDDAVDTQRSLDERGRQSLEVIPTSGPLHGTLCERIDAMSGVRSSIGVAPSHSARTTTGEAVTVIEATPSFDRFLDTLVPTERPNLQTSSHHTAYVGHDLAERIGLTNGSWLGIATPSAADASRTIQVTVVESTPRTRWFDDAIVVLAAPETPVTRCLVEPHPAARLDVITAIASLSPTGRLVHTSSVAPDLEQIEDPERRLDAIPGSLAVRLAGVLLTVGTTGWWYLRRTEWALYQAFGLSIGRLHLIVIGEWALVAGAPLLIGAAWATALSGRGTTPLAFELAAWNVLTTSLIALTAIPLWGLYLRVLAPTKVLQGI